MTVLTDAHSGLRWIVIALLIIAVVKGFQGARGNKAYTPKDDKINLFTMIAFHVQVLLGLVLYFVNGRYQIDAEVMGNSVARFFAVEHIFGMVIAMTVITIGRSKSKKIEDAAAKHKKIAVFYLIGLVITLISIPWPFRAGFEHLGWF